VLKELIHSGQAWAKFVEWITAQGGSRDQLENPGTLPTAPLIETVDAPQSGYIAGLDAAEVGKTGVELGGGRQKKGDAIDHRVGIICHAKIGAQLESGAPLFTIHAADRNKLLAARERLLQAVTWSETAVAVPPHLLKIIE
jgi:pyrimidine-nucleoside phosphorylase